MITKIYNRIKTFLFCYEIRLPWQDKHMNPLLLYICIRCYYIDIFRYHYNNASNRLFVTDFWKFLQDKKWTFITLETISSDFFQKKNIKISDKKWTFDISMTFFSDFLKNPCTKKKPDTLPVCNAIKKNLCAKFFTKSRVYLWKLHYQQIWKRSKCGKLLWILR